MVMILSNADGWFIRSYIFVFYFVNEDYFGFFFVIICNFWIKIKVNVCVFLE